MINADFIEFLTILKSALKHTNPSMEERGTEGGRRKKIVVVAAYIVQLISFFSFLFYVSTAFDRIQMHFI